MQPCPRLRDACRELGVALLACDAGLRAEGLAATALAPGAEVAGATAFLSAAAGATVISF
jgi:predicted peroxiredoxin